MTTRSTPASPSSGSRTPWHTSMGCLRGCAPSISRRTRSWPISRRAKLRRRRTARSIENSAALKRMFRLAQRAGLDLQLPYIPGLAEHNVRQGFFELAEAQVVFAHLPADLVAPFEVASITGWRIKSEILTRQKGHLDLHAGWLRL